MWPMKLDMTREECRGVLRRLELESYGTVISTFRAQGCLSKEKLRILEDLRRLFHITNDRHRAEARRVANDERLHTVAEIISGPNSGQDWRREGHRTFPVLPRTVPHTALTYIANTVYEQLTRANGKLLHPVETSCDRLKKAEERIKFELVKKEPSLYENGFVRDAAVVTSDPLQDIMSKSYINREETRPAVSKPVEKATVTETEPNVTTALNGEKPSEPSPAPEPEQSSLCEILLNTGNRSENSEIKSITDKSNIKPADRSPRKKPQPTKRAWKSKSSLPPAKQPKQGTLPKSVKQSASRANNMHSPHLIHSYAVPFDGKATNGSSEPPQLQQHLTSTSVPPAGQQSVTNPSAGTMPPPPPVKPQPQFATQTNIAACQGILPSSKKDIQYNLSKLNPTSNLATKGNVTIPLKGGGGFYAHGKSLPHPLLNYQKKSPSKNILIPTSTAAATLASLGFPSPLHSPLTDHLNSWVSAKPREKAVKHVKTIPSGTNAASFPALTAPERSGMVNQPPFKQIGKGNAETLEQNVEQSSHAKTTVTVSNHTLTESPPTTIKNTPSTQENGNAAAQVGPKSGNKIIVQSMQLLPPNSAAQNASPAPASQKNNVFLLPSGVLNLGQKITIPKSLVDTSAAVPAAVTSPPKVIVQTMPNPYGSGTGTEVTPQLDLNNVWKKACGRFMGGADEKANITIASSGTKMTGESSVDARPSQGQSAVPPDARSVAVKQSPSITIPLDGVSGRKITISTSQLVPFTGTLSSSALSKATGSVTVGNKRIKISTDEEPADVGGAGSTGKSFTDWENELDRTNATKGTNNADSKPDKPESINTTQKAETTPVEAGLNESGTDSTASGGGKTFQNTFDSHLSSTLTASVESETSHGEYDFISVERDDDSSVTDSADAEEEDDLDDAPSQLEDEFESIEEDNIEGEEPAVVDVEMETDSIIVEEEPANYDYLIEEVPEDEQFVEEEEADDGLVEYISVGYGTTSELVAELESGTPSAQQNMVEKHRSDNGVTEEELPTEIAYEQSVETAVENGTLQEFFDPADRIACDLLEMGTDGKYHARPYTYKQVMAEGMESSAHVSKQTQPTIRLS